MFMHSFLKDNHEELIRSCNTYAEVINKRSAANPDHVVFKFLPDGVNEDGSLTYQQLICKSKAVAAILQQNGSKGDNVLLLFQPGLDYIVSLFACLLSGFVAVPAYPPRRNRGIERIFKIIDDSEVQICLVSKHIYNDIQRNFSDDENLKGLSWVVYDDISNESSHGFIETELMPDDIALLQYTSGSTGDPKGVIISQKNLLYNSEYIRQSFNHDEHLVGVNWLPVFHDMGLIGTVLQPPYVGGVSYLMPPVTILKNPLIWLKAIEKYRANTVGGPNFIYDYCVQRISNEECKDLDLSSVNVFFCGAEPIREATLTSFAEKFKTAKATHEMLYPCYGMAETTLIVTGGVYNEKPVYLDIDADAFSKNTIEVVEEKGKNTVTLVSSGTTWLETEVLVVDPRTNNKLSEGNIGEVWIGGPTVASGYYGREDESVRLFNAFTSDSNEGPYFKSGDLGFIYNKEVFITGRLRDVIIIRGINFYPSDIEFLIQDNIKELKRNAGAAFSVVEEGQERLVIVQELERTAMRDTDHDYVIRKVRELVSEIMFWKCMILFL